MLLHHKLLYSGEMDAHLELERSSSGPSRRKLQSGDQPGNLRADIVAARSNRNKRIQLIPLTSSSTLSQPDSIGRQSVQVDQEDITNFHETLPVIKDNTSEI